MKQTMSTLLAIASVAYVGSARAQHGREDILASAPDNIGVADIGRLVTSEFRQLVGATNSIRPASESAVQVRELGRTVRRLRAVETDAELRANASAWGIGSASLAATSAERHAYFRVAVYDELHELSNDLEVPQVPQGAEWYISAVYVGRLYEVHFTRREGAFEGSLSVSALVGEGSIEGFARTVDAEFHARTIGLQPRNDSAIFANSQSEMEASYAARGPARPVLVRYSRVPQSSRPQSETSRPRRLTLVSVQFPDRNPDRNTAWDAFGGRPDILVRITQNGSLLLDAFGGRDSNPANINRLIGNSILVTPENPLVFQFSDRDAAAHDDAGQLVIATLPRGREFTSSPGTKGVRVTLQMGD